MNDDYSDLIAIRSDLCEAAFRKYESFIARAANSGTFVLDPKSAIMSKNGEYKALKAATFCTRFTDALRGYKLYSYPSNCIPSAFDCGCLKARPTTDGRVMIINSAADAKAKGEALQLVYDPTNESQMAKLLTAITLVVKHCKESLAFVEFNITLPNGESDFISFRDYCDSLGSFGCKFVPPNKAIIYRW